MVNASGLPYVKLSVRILAQPAVGTTKTGVGYRKSIVKIM